MVTEIQDAAMSEGRGLLTEEERKAIAGEKSDSYRWKTRSFFRSRLEAVEADIAILREQDPELLEELREVVCDESK